MKKLDTRDLNKRKEELESLRDALEEARKELADISLTLTGDEAEEAIEEAQEAVDSSLADFGDDEAEELAELEELESQISDWRYGETMIPVDDFEEYARELAEDIGAINRDASWPLYCIDWEKAAKELAMDYTEVEYLGTLYYIR